MPLASLLPPRPKWRPHRVGVALVALVVGSPACANLLDLGPERSFRPSDPDPTPEGGGGSGGHASTSNTSMSSASSTTSAGGGGEGGGALPGDCTGGEVLWALHLGSPGREIAKSVVPDGQGGVFVSGSLQGSLDLGGGALQSNGFSDIFLARFDEDGEHVWSASFGDAADQSPMSLAEAPRGGFVMAGSFPGTVDFGDGMPDTADGVDAAVVRYDAQGNLLWKRVYGGPGHQSVRGVAVDPGSGDVYLGGLFHVGIDLGGDVFSNAGDSDVFIAKLDDDGEHVWSRHLVGAEHDYANAVALDGQGHLLVGGSAETDIDLGQGTLSSYDDEHSDAWAALYDASSGAPIWTRLWADPGHELIRSVTFNAAGQPIIAGAFVGDVTLDSTSATFLQGIFVAEVAAPGVAGEAQIIAYAVDIGSLAADTAGNVFVSGYFANTLGTGSVPIPTMGGIDGMLVKLDDELDPVSTVVVGSTENDDTPSVTIDPGSNVYAVTNFRSTVMVPGCGSFTAFGDSDILLLKFPP